MMENIYKYKVGGIRPTTDGYKKNNYRGGVTVAPDIGKNHTFGYLTKQQLSVKGKALKWNMQEYEKLRKEYDALVYLIKTWRNIKEEERYIIRREHFGRRGTAHQTKTYTEFLKDYNKLYNKNENNTNKHPIINKYKELLEGRRPAFHGCFW